MTELEQAHEVTCPHCWQTITLWLDLSVGAQSYYEDCTVCCRPILVAYESAQGELTSLTATAAD